VILIFWLLRLSIKLKMVKKNMEKMQQEIEKLRNNTEILRTRLNQSQGGDVDISTLESQVEENSQQLVSYVQEGVARVSRDIRDLEERVDKLEEEQVGESEKLSEIENKIEDIEEEK
jgi:ubiquinone biosynthesis protein UbiJ